MEPEDIEEGSTLGTIRRVEVLGVDQLTGRVVLRAWAGADHAAMLPLGMWAVPPDVARGLAADLVELLNELDAQPPEPSH